MYARKQLWLSALTVVTLLLSACGSAASNESVIATSVAMTIQAQNPPTATLTPVLFPSATLPPGVTPVATLTNIVPTIGPTSSGGKSYIDCAKASLVNEDPPDGTLFAPEDTFYKTWQIKNESNCTWDTSYRIVFYDGDLMGGAHYYNLPQSAIPGQVIDIPLQLISPKDDGPYKGQWKLQTPDGLSFGVGQYSEPFYVDIVVDSNIKKDENKITKITYSLERDPAAGCATSVIYTVNATIETNGPIDVRIQWLHSDGYTSPKIRITLTEATTFKLIPEKGKGIWGFHLEDSPGDKWMQLWQVEPYKVEFGKVNFSYLCN